MSIEKTNKLQHSILCALSTMEMHHVKQTQINAMHRLLGFLEAALMLNAIEKKKHDGYVNEMARIAHKCELL
jgi:hypothetical protein